MFNYIFVGGRFGPKQKESSFIRKLFNVLYNINPNGLLKNGGRYCDLSLFVRTFEHIKNDVIFWMPDVSNDEEKLVDQIKNKSPYSLLITSKNNLEGKYSFLDLVSRALKVKANLCLEFTKDEKGKIVGMLFDPLGNQFCKTSDITLLAVTMMNRIQELLRYTRMASKPESKFSPHIPEENPQQFFELVRDYAEVFHNCIHGINTTRFLGNASFRCERGFPSYMGTNGAICVSQRNIDKRAIGPENFVPVGLRFDGGVSYVNYWGEHKPSVDTPVQVMLYHFYHHMKFMLHSHTYIKDAPFTSNRIPCGAIEEFYEILRVKPNPETRSMGVNLLGHGSIVMVDHLSKMLTIDYYPRPQPEIVPLIEID